jgi:uncharacterized protein (UPF0333 family)
MKKAQSVLEYALVIVAIVTALLAMGVYVQRSMQGRLKDMADSLGKQYNPLTATSVVNTDYDSRTRVETKTELDPTDNKFYTTTTNTILWDFEDTTGAIDVAE